MFRAATLVYVERCTRIELRYRIGASTTIDIVTINEKRKEVPKEFRFCLGSLSSSNCKLRNVRNVTFHHE